MRYLIGALAALLAAMILACVLAPARDVAATIHIAAPPARVWVVLTDTARYIGPPRVFRALHDFRLAPEDGGTRFTQSEHIRDVLLWLWDPGQLVPQFEAMNNRLKTEAEKPGTAPP